MMKKNKYIFITFAAALIPRLILAYFSFPLRTLSDETGTLASAIYFSGAHSYKVLPQAGYYGQGMSFLFVPLFILIKDPVLLYRVLVALCGLLLSLVVFIVYPLVKKLIPGRTELFYCSMAFLCSYFVDTENTAVFNEHMIQPVTWLLATGLFQLAKANKNKKQRFIYSLYCSALIGYLLTLHTRSLIYILALGAVIVIYWIFTRNIMFSVPAGAVLAVLFGASRLIRRGALSAFWQNNGVANVPNSTLPSASEGAKAFNIEYLQSFFDIILGELCTVNVLTGGIFISLVVIAVIVSVSLLKKAGELSNEDELLARAIVMIYFLGCIFATMLVMAIWWMPSRPFAPGTNIYALRSLTYLRYFMPYCGPFFLFAFSEFLDRKYLNVSYVVINTIVTGVVILYFLTAIIPLVYQVPGNNPVLLTFRAFSFAYQKATSVWTFGAGLLFSVIGFAAVYLCFYYKKYSGAVIIICAFMFHAYMYDAFTWDIVSQHYNYDVADGCEKVINGLIREGIEIPEQIYVMDTIDHGNQQNWYEHQFLLPDIEIIPDEPDEEVEEAIVFVNYFKEDGRLCDWVFRGYLLYEADIKEIMMVKGDELQQSLIDAGIELTDNFQTWKSVLDQSACGDVSEWDEGSILSNGSQGCVVEGQNEYFRVGTMEVLYEISVEKHRDEEIGTADIYSSKDSNVLVSYPITEDMIDKKGNIQLHLITPSDDASGMEFRVYANEGSVIRVNDILYSRCANDYDLASERVDEIARIKEIIRKINPKGRITYVLDNDMLTSYVKTNYLESVFGKYFSLKTESDAKNSGKEDFIIMPYDRSMIWEFIPEYTIIARTPNFVVFMRSDIKPVMTIEEAGGARYSFDDEILGDFFAISDGSYRSNDVGANLDFGNYMIRSVVSCESEMNHIGCFTVNELTQGEQSVDYISTEEGWEAEIPVYNYNKSEYVSYESKFDLGCVVKDQKVFIRRTDLDVGLDLTLLELEDGVSFKNEGICTNGVRGTLNRGPYFDFNTGSYRLAVKIFVKNFPDDGFFTVQVKAPDKVLASKSIYVEDLEELESDNGLLELKYYSSSSKSVEFLFDESEDVIIVIEDIVIKQGKK